MSEQFYDRTSRDCVIEDLDIRLRTVLLAEAERELLGGAAIASIACVETRSIARRRDGIFTRLLSGRIPNETLTAAVLLPRHLLIAVVDVQAESATAHSGRLADMTVSEVDERLAVDSGVLVFARWSNLPEASSLQVSLGDDAAGIAFKDELSRAIQKAKSG